VATVLGVAAALKKDPNKLNAAIAFVKYFFSEPVASRWIPLTWSPMGIVVPVKSIPNLDPLPKAWLTARDKATTIFALPATPAMQSQQWADTNTALQSLLLGKSVGAAQAAYEQYLNKYKS
jgi:ABC-type glycerol-3-phosphate transport system substrate-binding protein